MAYLLTLGWPWFAGALALGAFVGFLGFSRARDATFSGGWIVLLGLVALAIGFSASIIEAFSGRDAVALDLALLAGGAYAAGLPLGGMIKSLLPEPDRKRAAPAISIVVATIAPEPVVLEPVVSEPVAPEPVVTASAPEPVMSAEFADPPSMETPLAALEPATPQAAAPKARGKKAAGVKPETLPAPRDGGPDDLARIKGVGPKSLEKLNAVGVFHYDQIAAWDLDNARWIGAAIGAPGRVERDKWIQQARALASAGVEQ
jgi:predicted flap endonuclease-1-like 5' DNA nuclease